MSSALTSSTQSAAQSSPATEALPTSAATTFTVAKASPRHVPMNATVAKTHGLVVNTDAQPISVNPPRQSSNASKPKNEKNLSPSGISRSLPGTPDTKPIGPSSFSLPWIDLSALSALSASNPASGSQSASSSSAGHTPEPTAVSNYLAPPRHPTPSPPSHSPTYPSSYSPLSSVTAIWALHQAQRQSSPSPRSSSSSTTSTSGNTTPTARSGSCDADPSSIIKKVGRSSSSPQLGPLPHTSSAPAMELNTAHSISSSSPTNRTHHDEAYHARKAKEYLHLAIQHAEQAKKEKEKRLGSVRADQNPPPYQRPLSSPPSTSAASTSTTTAAQQPASAKATDPATPPAATDSGNTAASSGNTAANTESFLGKAKRIFTAAVAKPTIAADGKFPLPN